VGARTLEARLSARLLVLAVVVLTAVGITTALVTDRALAVADDQRAHDEAAGAQDSLAVELSEGDSHAEAAREVIAAADGEGVRLAIRFADGPRYSVGAGDLPVLAGGQCATVDDSGGRPWRACAAASPDATLVAAIPIVVHRQVVAAVWRAMAVLVVVATLLLWWAIRRAVRAPLAELTSLVEWTGRVRGREDLPDEPPPGARTTEIQHLATTFEALVRDLLEAVARERANSAHIAHELRTPLTAIVAELDALAAREPRTLDVVTRLRADVARLADVIDAILVLSDRSRGGRNEVVNVADLARELAADRVTVEAPDEALVEGDERLVRLAMRNLLDNANKHGGGGRILRVSREADRARIAVVDGGAGLDAGARERMFDRYWRGSADGDGRGLGLALVRAVAERHGGDVRAAAGLEGKGLEVSLTLAHVVGWHEPGRAPLSPG
jgi:two-component system, OmpR family, sensor histidine kinase MtrB